MLDAAIELIVEQGANISMMAIGQRSGFSHGLVLARFGSKAGLNEAVAREAQRRFAETVDATAAETKGIAKIHRILDIFFQSRLSVSTAFYVLLGAALSPNSDLRAAFAQADKVFRRYLQRQLEEAQAFGEVDGSLDASATATLLVGMMRGVAVQYHVNPQAFAIEAVSAQAHALIARLGKRAGTVGSVAAAAGKKLGQVDPNSALQATSVE